MAATQVIVRSFVPAVTARALARAEAATAAAARMVEAHAKARAPVDTGYLRNAINTQGGRLSYEVHSPADYSIYQEYGTRYMPAHPYMTPAAELVRLQLVAALGRIF